MKRKERKKVSKNAARIQTKELEARGVHMDMQTSWAAQELTTKCSNLDDMARFQQKQLQEKEQKLLQLYDQQQQRAYQVVQRGSAGSNGSSYGSSVSQHTITKTSTNSHTTSTSQGGKVRQMFDERRQTTVKGIDRSYPLEPLENKPRKQTNGNVQKNGNSSVNRHSVTVKRVARADVNSNLNAGKPIVSYHEEITRESFGPSSGRRQSDDDEFGNENHVSQYANGNHRDEIQIEEVLDEDAIERNRMMAKLHLMQYDDTLKQRIKNDLESEEFPEDFMVDVPDKLPKQSISKKLSQAEARLERFRNANAKRISNVTKNTSSSQVPKKRADTGFPGKATSRVVKSPSLDSTKAIETNSRTRRSVLSPSKSPDMATRRPSTELKASDTRSTKRTTPTKDTEPIGKRKTTTTTTTTRKSTDAVDGATVLENGLHLQDQTVETKYDNDPQTAKKTFVIDYEEQPPKENNGPLPRKPLLKKPSIEKQTPSTPMQASTSNTKSKMTMRAKTTNVSSSSRSSASSKSGSNCTPDLLVPCKICGRSFAQDRVTLHEQICSKTGQKRRKLFDSVMSRVKGTELENFVKKGSGKKQSEKPSEPKTNWRRKHEDFINAIRSAKQVQAHLAAGGKLSDLPPPPPSDTSDYVQCPHCGRKFNKPAAERHIPKCETMLHNKPIHSRAPKPRR